MPAHSAFNENDVFWGTMPGYGLLVHDAGVLAFDPAGDVTADHGPTMIFNGDTAKLCAALS